MQLQRPGPIRLALAVLALGLPVAASGIEGDLRVHDPSPAVRCGDRLWIFHTGRGCRSVSSADGRLWSAGPLVFPSGLPDWAAGTVPGNRGDAWAPDVVFAGGVFRLYYSVSTWGSQVSAIGLATSPTLDPADPAYGWTDRGNVIRSRAGDPYNTIDPSILLDDDSRHWLAFGSFWRGIHLVELSPATGARLAADSPVTHLVEGSVEAPCLHRRGAWYYLFYNDGTCCRGIRSTYRVRVGRSARVTGPYRDRDGVDLLAGGGTPFLESSGRYVGPGHAGILLDGGRETLSYHYYDGLRRGAPTLALEPLSWDAAGWPVPSNRWMSHWPFQGTAEDAVGGLDGELRDGAAIVEDPVRGKVLDLRGGASVALHAGAARARTFSAWVRWEGGPEGQRILDFHADATSYLYLSPRSTGGKVRFAITDSGQGGEQLLESGGPLPVGIWTHLAVTIGQGGPGTLYVDGKAAARSAAVTVDPWRLQATGVFLGKGASAADAPFTGRIDDLRIFSRVLTDAEVAAVAASKARDLLARDPLTETSGSVARDAGPNGNDAEIRGNPVRDGISYGFDGNADGAVDISDAVAVLEALFLGKAAPVCEAAADSNGDGAVDISDPVSVLMFLFTGGRPPVAPYPRCGVAPDPTALPCAAFAPCR